MKIFWPHHSPVSRWLYAGRSQPRNRLGSLFFAPCAFFAIPGVFLLEGMETYPIGPDERENKTRLAPNPP